MKLSQAFPSKYLKADDLQGRSHNVQISHYAIEDVGTDDKPVQKPVIYFSNAQKGMVLNRTNGESIGVVLGDEMDVWRGHTLELFPQRVQGPNGMVNAIRCRVVLPQQPMMQTPPAPQQPTARTASWPVPVAQSMPPPPQAPIPVDNQGVAAPAAGIERTLGAQGLDDDPIPF